MAKILFISSMLLLGSWWLLRRSARLQVNEEALFV